MKTIDTNAFQDWLHATAALEIGTAEWQVCADCDKHPHGVCDSCALEIAEQTIGGFDTYAAK